MRICVCVPLLEQREIVQMKLCNHPNVARSHCSFVQGHYLWLVMDYLAGGSVLDIMRFAHPNGLSDEPLIATILCEALHGIAYLHETGRIHRYQSVVPARSLPIPSVSLAAAAAGSVLIRDVKAGNMLVGADGHVLLGDFGVSAWLVESGIKRKHRQTFVGTRTSTAR